MNIVKLEHEQQTEVINSAVDILRKRMLGKVLRIDTINQEFLALNNQDIAIKLPLLRPDHTSKEGDDFITKSLPLEVSVISVSRAIEEAVRIVIAADRPHIEKPTVSDIVLSSMGERVIRLFNSSQKERIALPRRFAETVAQRMQDKELEIDSSEYQALHLLREYFQAEDSGIKAGLFDGISKWLIIVHNLNEENKNDDANYDLSSLSRVQEEKEEDPETKFKPGDIFATGGWLDMGEPVVDADFRLEMEHDMKLSETERELVRYLPREIEHDTRLISETYYWTTYGEEWQRELLELKNNAPREYLQMLERILMRKLIIYTHADQALIWEEAKQWKSRVDKKLCGKIWDCLPDLEEEIKILWGKIKKIKNKKTPSENTKKGPSGIQAILEGSFSALRKKYRNALKRFLEFENYDEVEKAQSSLIHKYADLESHCLKNGLESVIIGVDIPEVEGTEKNLDGIITVDEYLGWPEYFRDFPTALLDTKSESEKILEMVCHFAHNPIFSYGTGEEPLLFIYREDDGSETPDNEKMRVIESIIHAIIERKMTLYFHTAQWLEDHESEQAEYYKYILENEIYAMEDALKMIARRIRWEDDVSQKGPELQAEIDYLSQCRNNLLGKFVGEHDKMICNNLEWKILAFTSSIASRNKELSQTPTKTEKPHSHIQAEPLSPSEWSLVRYVPIPLRKSESILFGRLIPYFAKKIQETPDHKWEKKKIQANHHLERKMMIYLFSLKRRNAIDEELMNWECPNEEQLKLEMDLIEEKSSGLHKEMLNLISEITELNKYDMEQAEWDDEELSQLLCNKAMSLHAQLDGKLAHSDTDFAKKVEYYWHTLQRYVLRFRSRVLIATEKWHLESLKQIQAEFDTEMHFIILDMQKTLGELQASKKTTEKMVATVTTIRKELFGNTSEK